MSQHLTFQQAVNYLNEGFNYKATGKSGTVTLKNASQEDCLILQSEDGGERVSLFAPFLERPQSLEVQKILNLHLLHLNGDLDTLGPLRITLNTDSNRYSLCDGALMAKSVADFTEYLQEVLRLAHYLHREISDVMAQAQRENELDFDGSDNNANFIKA
jgi:hypothetical protein